MASSPLARPEPRIAAFYGIIAVAFLILIGQLWNIQIANGAQFRQRAEVNRIRVISEKALRGVIYDRRGHQLARNVPSFSATVLPVDLPRDAAEQEAVLARLGQVIEMPLEEVKEIVRQGRRDPFTPVRIKAPITRNQALILQEQRTQLPGVVVRDPPIRGYDEGAIFGHLLGYTGPLPQQRLEALLAQGYERDDSTGITGIEAAYEAQLRGTHGRIQVEVDAMGGVTRRLETLVPTKPGGNLVLTLDAQLQRRATEVLTAAMAKGRSGQAALVALQPQTGEVLAMVSLPQYDNNLFASGISQEDFKRLNEDRWHPLVNHAVSGQYPPGSTFKMVTAAAALQERVVTPETRIFCPGSLTVSGRTFTDWSDSGHGNVNARHALATSCDIYFWSLAGGNPMTGLQGLRIERLAEYARAFGFGEKTGLRLGGESAGLVPTREWKRQRGDGWYIGDDYNVGIGQGDVLATPLQLANMTAALANGGMLYRPRLVREVRDADGVVIETFQSEVIRRVPVAPEYMAAIRAGMRDVVAATDGTAYYALRQPTLTIAGKTGSAEYSGGPRDSRGKLPSHALFVGYAPYEDPEIAVAVVVYGGGEGSEVAAPAAADVMKAYFELPRT
ncbi:MAG TPA: penicillin-binding protein 2 [Chloroflexota bacterium]|nr:penicillin-binding protein 2 [Chloroflexota bacterium]